MSGITFRGDQSLSALQTPTPLLEALHQPIASAMWAKATRVRTDKLAQHVKWANSRKLQDQMLVLCALQTITRLKQAQALTPVYL